jgi:hypothetical protein
MLSTEGCSSLSSEENIMWCGFFSNASRPIRFECCYSLYYFPHKNVSFIWRHHHCRWRAAKFKPMLGAQSLWAGRGVSLSCYTCCKTRPRIFRSHPKDSPFEQGGVSLSCYTCCNTRPRIFRSHPKDSPTQSRHTRGCGRSILTRILARQSEYGKANGMQSCIFFPLVIVIKHL